MWRLLAGLGTALLMTVCGPGATPVSTTPAPTPTPTPLPSSVASNPPLGASTPEDAVRALLATGGATICRPPTGVQFSQAAGCPVTLRLQQRLQSNPTSGSGGGADPVCRCQNLAPVALTRSGGAASGTALVTAAFQFQPPMAIRFTTLQQAQGSGWLVDDSDCGGASTSIYVTPVRPCT